MGRRDFQKTPIRRRGEKETKANEEAKGSRIAHDEIVCRIQSTRI